MDGHRRVPKIYCWEEKSTEGCKNRFKKWHGRVQKGIEGSGRGTKGTPKGHELVYKSTDVYRKDTDGSQN